MRNQASVPVGLPAHIAPVEFTKLTMPVLLVIGDHEVILTGNAEEAIAAGRCLIPALETALIANGGHAVTIDQAEAVNLALISFLDAGG